MTPLRRYQGATEDDYPQLREMLAPQYRNLPTGDIEALFEGENLSAEDVEGFFDTLKDIGKAVVSAAPTILPVAGTVVGTAYGGPAGAALGGTLGNLAGGAIGQATGTRPSTTRPQVTSAQAQPPGAAQSLPGAAPAANQLLQILFSPEMLQALMQMLLGQLGASNVNVGSTPVPVGAFTNLLGTLVNQAQAQHIAANPTPREAIPEYLIGSAGEAVGDPAIAEHRAQRLYEMLQETDMEPVSSPRVNIPYHSTYFESDGEDEDEFVYFELEPEPAETDAEDTLW